jgi:hypothetical protein
MFTPMILELWDEFIYLFIYIYIYIYTHIPKKIMIFVCENNKFVKIFLNHFFGCGLKFLSF